MDAIICEECKKTTDEEYECDGCGKTLCFACRIDFTVGPGKSYGYCYNCSLCPICGNEHNMHDDFHCDCGVTGCEDCKSVCDMCGEEFCADCIKTHHCVEGED